jgi:hypothetical protein
MKVDVNPPGNSFVDRDMIMRYHWGLAIGHTYMHEDSQIDPSRSREGTSRREEDTDADGHATIAENEEEDASMTNLEHDDEGGSAAIPENEEGADEECRDEHEEEGEEEEEEVDMSDPGDEEESGHDDEEMSDPGDEEESGHDDEEALALDDMYGESADIEYYE